MLYFELGLCDEDYLTDMELKCFWRFSRFVSKVKKFLGIIVKKKIEDKNVYLFPNVNKKFLKKIKKIIKISGQKQICISDELFYKNEFVNLIKQMQIDICDGKWLLKYTLEYILKYIKEISKTDFRDKEIAFLVDDNYELVIEYIKKLADEFKVITVVTDRLINFSKISDSLFKNEGIEINLVNNYRKSLNKADIIVNIDFTEKEIKKYFIYNKTYFINFANNYEIKHRKFEGININNLQIALPYKYLKYADGFKNYNYLNLYESFIKKKTSIINILNEIENDNLEIIFLENENGMIKNEEFTRINPKILDK